MSKWVVVSDGLGWSVEKPSRNIPERFCRSSSLANAVLIRNILNGLSNEEWIKHLNRSVKDTGKLLNRKAAA